MAPSSRNLAKTAANMGQVVEYIPDRLYLASYTSPPTADTLFPYPAEQTSRSPTKRSRAVESSAQPPPRQPHQLPLYFTVDDALLYNAFHHDFGPLHVGHLYRFALYFHDILGDKENKDRPVVFWSKADPRSRANAACMLACYMVLIQSWPPHLALAPIAQLDPPLMPFRDAGYSQADYGISVQDVVYGVWKAKEEKCCALENFDLDEYEKYERVEHGDFNWVTPHFVAFASPQHMPVDRITADSELYTSLPRTLAAVDAHPQLPQPFKNVLKHFSEKNVGLVVRLNSALYSPSYFEALGIQHLDMIFEDGTCPQLTAVRKFIRLAHETITVKKKSIAVHCKAGLGRTGCLIGAYLIYRHGFTANEVISFMRFMRPGMVVGPQQHWLHINQGVFREWWIEERIERRLRREAAAAKAAPSTPIRAMQKANLGRSGGGGGGGADRLLSTPPQNRSVSNRTPLSEIDQERTNGAPQEDYLPAPTPGQPRKTGRAAATERHHPYARSTVTTTTTTVEEQDDGTVAEETEEIEVLQQQRSSHGALSDEELHLRMRSQRNKTASSSPDRYAAAKSRSVSHSVTTTSSSSYREYIDNDASNDVENLPSPARAKPAAAAGLHDHRVSSASGVLTKVRSGTGAAGSNKRSAPLGQQSAGVRKTSGRVGSVSSNAVTATAVTAARKVSGL